jgi:hypothetical protein
LCSTGVNGFSQRGTGVLHCSRIAGQPFVALWSSHDWILMVKLFQPGALCELLFDGRTAACKSPFFTSCDSCWKASATGTDEEEDETRRNVLQVLSEG